MMQRPLSKRSILLAICGSLLGASRLQQAPGHPSAVLLATVIYLFQFPNQLYPHLTFTATVILGHMFWDRFFIRIKTSLLFTNKAAFMFSNKP